MYQMYSVTSWTRRQRFWTGTFTLFVKYSIDKNFIISLIVFNAVSLYTAQPTTHREAPSTADDFIAESQL